jgi:hypothetical protein
MTKSIFGPKKINAVLERYNAAAGTAYSVIVKA